MEILTVYFIFNFFLFFMSGYLFLRTTPDLMKKREYLIFRIFILAFLFYTIMNTLWTMQEFDVISLPEWLFTIICFLSLSSVLFNCFCFYKLVMVYFGYSNSRNTLYELYGFLPFIITEIFLFISIFNGRVFSISEEGNLVHGDIYFILVVCAFIYFAIILVSSLVEMLRSNSPQTRKNYLIILLLVIFLVSWIIVDDMLEGLTIIPIAIFSVILTLFTTFQQSSINTDALTQMNNRRKAMEYLVSQISNVSLENPLYLYLCDINSFKAINDNYGHLEGDSALVILGDSIKEVVGEIQGFAARYGGDEFIIAIKSNDPSYEKDEIIKRIANLTKEKCKQQEKPYDISVAAGCVICIDPKVTVEAYLDEADELLYEQKDYNKKD